VASFYPPLSLFVSPHWHPAPNLVQPTHGKKGFGASQLGKAAPRLSVTAARIILGVEVQHYLFTAIIGQLDRFAGVGHGRKIGGRVASLELNVR
jgi:hypothetical protein